ncbi:MAG: transposase [Sedimenticola sp.]
MGDQPAQATALLMYRMYGMPRVHGCTGAAMMQDADLAGRLLQIALRVIERTLREHCPAAPASAKYGGVTYIHRFGSALNPHLHYHSCMIDGLFAQTRDGLQFYEATGLSSEVIQQAQEKIRKRVLRLFVRRGLLSTDDAEQMQIWQNGGGFSLNAEVRIEATDRQGLERLFRYCARPIFAGDRLRWQEGDEMLIYQLPKPRHDGQTLLRLTPAEFLDRIAILIPPPRGVGTQCATAKTGDGEGRVAGHR